MAWYLPWQRTTGTSSPPRVKYGPGRAPGVRLQDDAQAGEDGYGRFVRTIADVPAARQRPPFTTRLSPRHWTALDYVVGALCGVILFASIRHSVIAAMSGPFGALPYRPLALAWPLAVFLVFTAVFAVALRRRQPALMLGVLLAGSLVITALTGPEDAALTYFLPVAYVLYLVAATYERRRAAVRVLVAVFSTLVADAVLMSLTGGGNFLHGGLVSVTLCVIIAWITGYVVRQRRRYAVRLQDEAASKAVAEERLRIARELHDVVAHSMSVIAVQAGYGQYVIDTQPADARNALGAIQATSREALDEMRRMLGALRQADQAGQHDVAAQAAGGSPAVLRAPGQRAGDADCVPLFPAPGLADLDRLLSRTASAGVRVDVTRCGQPRELPASIDLSAYRIVQEALTNVVKHARTSSCQVLIGYGRDELILEVTDNGAGVPVMAGAGGHNGTLLYPGTGATWSAEGSSGAGVDSVGPDRNLPGRNGLGRNGLGGSGHGIIGMRERVMLLGGDFSAVPRSGYGFQVVAHIPLTTGSS
ncbi:MAG: sensor histidine kinase [Actinomycetota bacterium]|nr:sensor histidine kinase [Actinomycetota bacterium]